MKLQCFIRSAPRSFLRVQIAEVARERWRMFDDVDLRWIRPHEGENITNWHWECRRYADAYATSDYLYGDDDILPIDANFVRHFIEDWAKCPPDVVMLGSVSAIWCERIAIDGVGEMREGPVGGLCMIRRGVIPWHEFSGPANQDDGEIADWIRSHGYRTMVSPRLVRNHVGYGLSELNRNCWMRC